MVRLNDLDYIKQLKADLESAFDGERGKRLMEYLHLLCNYDTPGYDPEITTTVFMCAGRREVLMTLKAILRNSPEEIVEYFNKM